MLGLPIRAVEAASSKLAERLGNPGYFIPISRLSDIETKGVLPSLYRLYSLAVIYRKDYREILSLFGIPDGDVAADLSHTRRASLTWKAKPWSRPRSPEQFRWTSTNSAPSRSAHFAAPASGDLNPYFSRMLRADGDSR